MTDRTVYGLPDWNPVAGLYHDRHQPLVLAKDLRVGDVLADGTEVECVATNAMGTMDIDDWMNVPSWTLVPLRSLAPDVPLIEDPAAPPDTLYMLNTDTMRSTPVFTPEVTT